MFSYISLISLWSISYWAWLTPSSLSLPPLWEAILSYIFLISSFYFSNISFKKIFKRKKNKRKWKLLVLPNHRNPFFFDWEVRIVFRALTYNYHSSALAGKSDFGQQLFPHYILLQVVLYPIFLINRVVSSSLTKLLDLNVSSWFLSSLISKI